MSGGQAKNGALMQLMADVCGMGIVLPKSGKEGKKGGVIDPVVLGSTMLGRYADEARRAGAGGREGQAERLWDIMVCFISLPFFHFFPTHYSPFSRSR
jgi:FGGY family of carbohydrate kinases, C-terminal domain